MLHDEKEPYNNEYGERLTYCGDHGKWKLYWASEENELKKYCIVVGLLLWYCCVKVYTCINEHSIL